MAISMGNAGDEDEVNSTINTTPLVDVMLVLLIIFLITVPVAIQNVPVQLPQVSNIPTQTSPENVSLSVDRDGNVYWNTMKMRDYNDLLERMKQVAVLNPQPEVHIRADKDTRFEYVGRVVVTTQRGGIGKIGFITEPQSPGQ